MTEEELVYTLPELWKEGNSDGNTAIDSSGQPYLSLYHCGVVHESYQLPFTLMVPQSPSNLEIAKDTCRWMINHHIRSLAMEDKPALVEWRIRPLIMWREIVIPDNIFQENGTRKMWEVGARCRLSVFQEGLEPVLP